ncbi:hypothetical protein A3A76_05890 [Candidatus Woesebacteria bacterium RIFCSPLOWO2_01_FULL_39_23]|uniref:Glutamyl-tRNA amidotransferase n=1 Tax=Candidatus Woesebacteria bacterium RIFCSPHIGHO2_01_FULL_40_22 TaxID=1802499 RepID=A0A1F7YI09_9BACT|nr:MAG: hypothetical protein A2141_02590 [Candidatus Woesebacteria bacterium RBG_16_40_11]OGM26933.1 MAG: hypothetical protein A2628_05835 [Candidatus Woesebacteria bacterium RIFCSPHIGHO2_01_FULL_40_22]OGM37342.1 MAG: hypothetical protein A3E41_04230 [Candidatus Woesebacteria bacterium RIFCSPHIGHO2_12_FULL_38_9]OGM63207.1 MAG: hypothetical protein A3A76_05890 [Candidatus Woesebacteria bacterium RIFCSPLOWO2_01_FULL_39_23]
MIADTITQKIGEALKAHDEIRLSALRMLSSALNYEFIAKQHKLSVEEELTVIKREVKKRQEAIDSLHLAQEKSSTSDPATLEKRIKQEGEELNILKAYLPPEMSEEELGKLIDEVIKDLPADALARDVSRRDASGTHQALQAGMGRVIGGVMKKAGGKADGKKVAEMVKAKLVG